MRRGVSFNLAIAFVYSGTRTSIYISARYRRAQSTQRQAEQLRRPISICDTSNTASVRPRDRSSIDPAPDFGTMVSSRNRSYSIFHPRDFTGAPVERARFRPVELSLSAYCAARESDAADLPWRIRSFRATTPQKCRR